ncbi:peptide transporter family 1-like isoform X2 [Ornithodoros turicata]|uniref:peptide transporter family 1-like isoform X2 n=1 Tax=Ornithodoros turicata TaxID=34597 RepID=UPI003139387A
MGRKENEAEKAVEQAPKPYPRAVFFIIGNEFCERFSYYGMKAILTLYLINVLMFEEHTAKSTYHIFSMACYFTPVFGAMLADSYLGKFRTIFYISIIYAIGNVTLAVAATPSFVNYVWIPMVGLALIAIGTGGIKPCVSAFGGDQFVEGQETQLEQFFSLFYLSINAGSLLSTFITPILRVQKCMGMMFCFPLAFGVPAALMVVALILFLIGKPLYRIIPPSGNVVLRVLQCIFHALKKKLTSKEKKDHWLDHAEPHYGKDFITDIKDVLHVLVLYVPLPVFWALFDQQGSQWTLQARQMDGEIMGYRVLPDQMQLANPLLILILVPVFSYGIYPLLAKCSLLKKPLQRITIGGLAAAGAFVIAGFLQLALEQGADTIIPTGQARVNFLNTVPCDLMLQGPDDLNQDIASGMVHINNAPAGSGLKYKVSKTSSCGLSLPDADFEFDFNATNAYAVIFTVGNGSQPSISAKTVPVLHEKFANLTSGVGIAYALKSPVTRVVLSSAKEAPVEFIPNDNTSTSGHTNYASVVPGTYDVQLVSDGKETSPCSATLRNGGHYFITLMETPTGSINCSVLSVVAPNSLSLFYQIPQYFVITAGEVMFSVTGLEFSYSQAPPSMKSVLQAAWLLTVAFGNIIVVIVAESRIFEYQSSESFMYAGLMTIDMALFAVMAYFYKYITPRSRAPEEAPEKQPDKQPDKPAQGYENNAYEKDTKM